MNAQKTIVESFPALLVSTFKEQKDKYLSHSAEIDTLRAEGTPEALKEYWDLHNLSIQRERLQLTLLCHNVVEALANMTISLLIEDREVFKLSEKSSVIDKWVTVPKFIIRSYQFDRGGQLFEDLKLLVRRRNAIVHSKPHVKRGNTVIHAGSIPEPSNADHELLLSWITLPERLLAHVGKYAKKTVRKVYLITGL